MSIIVERITMEMMFRFKFYKWNVFFTSIRLHFFINSTVYECILRITEIDSNAICSLKIISKYHSGFNDFFDVIRMKIIDFFILRKAFKNTQNKTENNKKKID